MSPSTSTETCWRVMELGYNRRPRTRWSLLTYLIARGTDGCPGHKHFGGYA